MKRAKQLLELGRVTEASLTAAQGRMRKIQIQEEKLRDQLAQLARHSPLSDEEQYFVQQSGADVRWQRWVDQRREQINVELAQILALKEDIRQKLRLAFGKDLALQLLYRQEFLKENRDKNH